MYHLRRCQNVNMFIDLRMGLILTMIYLIIGLRVNIDQTMQ